MNDMPVLYDQCVKVWNAMSEQADEEGIYRGYTTYLIESLGLTVSVYTPITRRLGPEAMNCMRQLYRGGRGVPSEWEMLRPPTEELFRSTSGHRRSRLRDLENRVNELERRVG